MFFCHEIIIIIIHYILFFFIKKDSKWRDLPFTSVWEREFIYRIQRNLNNKHYVLKLYGKRTKKSNKGRGNDKTKQFYWMQMSVQYQLFILLFERRNFPFTLRLHFSPLSIQTFNTSSTIKYRKHVQSKKPKR